MHSVTFGSSAVAVVVAYVKRAFRLLLIFNVAICCNSAFAEKARAVGQFHMPDPGAGVIDGQPAIIFWPQAADTHQLLDPSGCEVHTLPRGGTPEGALVFRCGEWFVPPVGSYVAWIESDRWMSPNPIVFSYGGGPFRGRGTEVVTPVMPAGRVVVSFQDQAPRTARFHFLSLVGKGYPIERSATQEQTSRGIRMPALGCVVGLFDENDEAIAISRPVKVRAGQVVNLTLFSPKAPTVVAVLQRPVTPKGRNIAPVRVAVRAASLAQAPDVLLDTPGRVYCIWYALPKTQAHLVIESDELALNPVELLLDRRTISTVRTMMTMIGRPPERPVP